MTKVTIKLDPDKQDVQALSDAMKDWLETRDPDWNCRNMGARWGEHWDFYIPDARVAVMFKLVWGGV